MTQTLPIEQFQLHPNGPTVSRLVYGTWRFLDVDDEKLKTPEAVLERVKRCVELGITTFDIYGHPTPHACESLLGAALALDPTLRPRIQLITKTGINLSTPTKHYNLSKPYILHQLQKSLSALQTDYVDILLIHRPSPFTDPDEIAEAFKELKATERVKYFGVSNFTPGQMEVIQSRLPDDITLVTNQVEMSPLCLDAFTNGTVDYAQTNRMRCMAWSPLGGGALFKSGGGEKVQRVRKVLQKLADRKGVGMDQIVYAWLLKHPSGIVVVLGTNSLGRVEEAVKAKEVELTLEEWFEVWEAGMGEPVP